MNEVTADVGINSKGQRSLSQLDVKTGERDNQR